MPNQITTPDQDVNATQGQKRYNDFATATMIAKSANAVNKNTDEVEPLLKTTNSLLTDVLAKLDTIIANQGQNGS